LGAAVHYATVLLPQGDSETWRLVSGLAEVFKDELTEEFRLLKRREMPSSGNNDEPSLAQLLREHLSANLKVTHVELPDRE
jgi:hypothetical protein